jgi:cytochrome d ubiquinol oxidase subunit I
MGLALLLVILKTLYMRKRDEKYNNAARFWGKIFAITFVMGVITGIPLEFQFGTNWAAFSEFAGGIIGQTLAMEGAFAFFLESAFVGLFLFGERRFGQRVHWFSAFMVFLGTWASGYFILATNSWMQHPVGYKSLPDGSIELESYWAVLLNPWVFPQYMHNQGAAVVTGSFVMTGLGAFYLLSRKHETYGRLFVGLGVIVGVAATLWMLMPSGRLSAEQVAKHQPVTLAAMEGHFETETGDLVFLGQPNVEEQRLDNPIVLPGGLSFLLYQDWGIKVNGLDAFPEKNWPDNIPLLYYSYHIMAGLGTTFIGIMGIAFLLLIWRRTLFRFRPYLWVLMLATPFPFIANTAGWMTAELGRQPWLAYGLFRTEEGVSPLLSSGNAVFTLIGFAGMYLIMGLLYFLLMVREIAHGPEAEEEELDVYEMIRTT